MGRGSPIPPMLQRKIVEQYQKGVSQRKIAKSLKLSSSTVHNIIQRFRESGTISVHKGQGRKTILDARDLRALRRHCITYGNATVMEITTWAQEYLQKTLSVNIIHRAIRRCRLKLYRSKKKPYLNMIQKCRCFLWAKAHLKWTVTKWKTVLWSDELKFEVLFGKLGRHVIRTKEDKDNPSCYQRSVQKPASLMRRRVPAAPCSHPPAPWGVPDPSETDIVAPEPSFVGGRRSVRVLGGGRRSALLLGGGRRLALRLGCGRHSALLLGCGRRLAPPLGCGRRVGPFGLAALINDVHRDFLNVFVFAYLDNILIFSRSPKEHICHVCQVLQRLLENKLFVKAEKW
ncbi:hypothetical protein QTP86_009476 [Hemibagrus guttatus]|nr:hypothetical protein QTP86_009476 [Hemibagrus guttatus]